MRSDNVNYEYYTVDKIAEMLNMHPKTIQRYIREGKLKAAKVGKSWRISGHDLSIFAEGTDRKEEMTWNQDAAQTASSDKINVSAVIDVNVSDREEAIQIANTMTAILNAKPPEYGKSTMTVQFLESESKVRMMLWGNALFMETMLRFLSELTGQKEKK